MSEPSHQAPLDPRLLEILVCPLTKGPLEYDREAGELISRKAGLAYPVRDGIPIMLVDEARKLDRVDAAISDRDDHGTATIRSTGPRVDAARHVRRRCCTSLRIAGRISAGRKSLRRGSGSWPGSKDHPGRQAERRDWRGRAGRALRRAAGVRRWSRYRHFLLGLPA